MNRYKNLTCNKPIVYLLDTANSGTLHGNSIFMLLNLSRAFSFNNDADVFKVDYIFQKNTAEGAVGPQIWLVFNVSMNDAAKQEYRLGMTQATLYQNNDTIEAMIKKETLMMQPA